MKNMNGRRRDISNRTSIMNISSILNHSDNDTPGASIHRAQPPAPYVTPRSVRRTHPARRSPPKYSAATLTRPLASSSTSPSAENIASSPRRANRPKYSEEEEAFIWFHRVDLAQEWDMVVRAFNARFRHSRPRPKSGLECKLYRVLIVYGVPQIREWRKRGGKMVEEVTGFRNYGIIEATFIRYPWMGPRYWPVEAWQGPAQEQQHPRHTSHTYNPCSVERCRCRSGLHQ